MVSLAVTPLLQVPVLLLLLFLPRRWASGTAALLARQGVPPQVLRVLMEALLLSVTAGHLQPAALPAMVARVPRVQAEPVAVVAQSPRPSRCAAGRLTSSTVSPSSRVALPALLVVPVVAMVRPAAVLVLAAQAVTWSTWLPITLTGLALLQLRPSQPPAVQAETAERLPQVTGVVAVGVVQAVAVGFM